MRYVSDYWIWLSFAIGLFGGPATGGLGLGSRFIAVKFFRVAPIVQLLLGTLGIAALFALVAWYAHFAHEHFPDPYPYLSAFGLGGLLGAGTAYVILVPRTEKFFSQAR
jgi:hypothetical protein